MPIFSRDGKTVLKIEEKPKKPKSSYALTGMYLFDACVFSYTRMLVPSTRGELEMTDVLNLYIKDRTLTPAFVRGAWIDAGTIDSLFNAAAVIRGIRQKKC